MLFPRCFWVGRVAVRFRRTVLSGRNRRWRGCPPRPIQRRPGGRHESAPDARNFQANSFGSWRLSSRFRPIPRRASGLRPRQLAPAACLGRRRACKVYKTYLIVRNRQSSVSRFSSPILPEPKLDRSPPARVGVVGQADRAAGRSAVALRVSDFNTCGAEAAMASARSLPVRQPLMTASRQSGHWRRENPPTMATVLTNKGVQFDLGHGPSDQ